MESNRNAVRKVWWVALFAVALTLMGGCKTDTTPVKTLLDDPGRFDGQVVRISGDVTGAVGVLGYGAYQVDDGTGTLTVVSEQGGAPRQGAKVGVEGTFRAAFTLKTETIAVLVEKKRYTP